jgi:hypothetical protein
MDVKIISSFLFSTNVLTNLFLGNYIYAVFFTLLFIISSIHHYINNNITFIFDQIALYLVIIYGGYYFIKHKSDYSSFTYYLVLITFIACFILYYGGKKYEKFCFHPQKDCADTYHILMHLCASVGHHLIAFV